MSINTDAKQFLPLTSEQISQKHEQIKMGHERIAYLKGREQTPETATEIFKNTIDCMLCERDLNVNARETLRGRYKSLQNQVKELQSNVQRGDITLALVIKNFKQTQNELQEKQEAITQMSAMISGMGVLLSTKDDKCTSLEKELTEAKAACAAKDDLIAELKRTSEKDIQEQIASEQLLRKMTSDLFHAIPTSENRRRKAEDPTAVVQAEKRVHTASNSSDSESAGHS